jgi:hypothetical protein
VKTSLWNSPFARMNNTVDPSGNLLAYVNRLLLIGVIFFSKISELIFTQTKGFPGRVNARIEG